MPAIYQSFMPQPQDDSETRQKRLYLAIISCEEQAYTLGAALSECRKQLTTLDNTIAALKKEYNENRKPR